MAKVKKIIPKFEVAIIGQGYVGLNLAMAIVEVGIPVIGIDTSKEVVNNLSEGESHIEGVPNAALKSALVSGSYLVTDDFSKVSTCKIVILAVPTPIDEWNQPNLRPLVQACDLVAPHLSESTLIINESTSFIGCLRNLVATRISKSNDLSIDFAISPERVDPGNKLFKVKNTARIVGGLTESATSRALAFYRKVCDNVFAVSSAEVAEAAKLLENTYRFVNIAFINEFARLMNTMNIPAQDVIEAAATKPFGFARFVPSSGVGGHCIPVDPFYLQLSAVQANQPLNFITLSREIDDRMATYSVDQLEKNFGILHGKSVLVIGVSYKPNIADTRESASWKVIEELKLKGANVEWHDPIVESHGTSTSSRISQNFDVGLVVVNHDNLDFSDWGNAPVYCINRIDSQPAWIPLIGT